MSRYISVSVHVSMWAIVNGYQANIFTEDCNVCQFGLAWSANSTTIFSSRNSTLKRNRYIVHTKPRVTQYLNTIPISFSKIFFWKLKTFRKKNFLKEIGQTKRSCVRHMFSFDIAKWIQSVTTKTGIELCCQWSQNSFKNWKFPKNNRSSSNVVLWILNLQISKFSKLFDTEFIKTSTTSPSCKKISRYCCQSVKR